MKTQSEPKIVADKCMTWLGATTTGGYGQKKVAGRNVLVHRWAWTVMYGEIPAGKIIRHLCHNPRCYNVAHLAIGTQVENAVDAVERGTRPIAGASKSSQRY